jgi:uncharacterized membrane protein YphA (DoxX/SURF4 family)
MKSSATPADLAATAGSSSSPSRRRPRLLATISRLLMGLMFFVFGLNGFLNLIPPPSDPMPEGAVAFATALGATGYMFPLVKGTEIVVGLLLLANRFVPLALVVLTPVLVNIVAFHVFLAPTGTLLTAVIVGLQIHLAWAYRDAYRQLLTPRAVAR